MIAFIHTKLENTKKNKNIKKLNIVFLKLNIRVNMERTEKS